jgi:hypothetical protein
VSVWIGDRWRCNARPDRPWQTGPLTSAPRSLDPVSNRLPRELLDRLRIAAPQLRLRRGEIAAAAIDRFLSDYGF